MLRSADHLWDMFLEGINEGCGLGEELPIYIDIRRTTKATISQDLPTTYFVHTVTIIVNDIRVEI